MWIETFGMTILEAMAYGIPVIAPPIGGPKELIRDGREGRLIDSRNIDELIETILNMHDNHKMMKDFSVSARLRSKEFNDPDLSFLNEI